MAAPESEPASGSGAGEVSDPFGVAADPVSGDVYVADRENERVDEFTAWGEFVKAFGWGVDAAKPEEKLQVCTIQTGCLAGSEGSGSGQFSHPGGVAVDGSGDVYVVDVDNHRVEKFDSSGSFLLMFGGEVNASTHGDVCVAGSGDTCGKGLEGVGDGEFKSWATNAEPSSFTVVGTGPAGRVYVGDEDRVQEFNSEGVYEGQVGLPAEGEVRGGAKEGKGKTYSLAVDGIGDIYFDFVGEANHIPGEFYAPFVYKHTASGWSVFASLEYPQALAVAANGDVYAVGSLVAPLTHSLLPGSVFEFDQAGSQLIPSAAEEQARIEAEERHEPVSSVRSTPLRISVWVQPDWSWDRQWLWYFRGGSVCDEQGRFLWWGR